MSTGRATALWRLSRPALLPYVLALPLVGLGWAHWDRALSFGGRAELGSLMALLVAWWLLHAGTLWLNAALDRDDGAVLMGRAAPVTSGTAAAGYVALVLSVVVGALAGPIATFAVGACAVLAVLYSHPSTAWKGHPVGGPFTNLVGYGLLSPMAGWSIAGVDPNPRTLVVWVLGACGVVGTYFAAQAFQQEEDAARGYRTLVVTHGPRKTIFAARLGIGVGFAGAFGLAVAGWLPQVLVVAPLLWWPVEHWLRRWSAVEGGGGPRWAEGMTVRLLLAAVVGLALVSADYVRGSVVGLPVAGLGTVAGLPSDRPALPPHQLELWEARRALETEGG